MHRFLIQYNTFRNFFFGGGGSFLWGVQLFFFFGFMEKITPRGGLLGGYDFLGGITVCSKTGKIRKILEKNQKILAKIRKTRKISKKSEFD